MVYSDTRGDFIDKMHVPHVAFCVGPCVPSVATDFTRHSGVSESVGVTSSYLGVGDDIQDQDMYLAYYGGNSESYKSRYLAGY